MKKLCSWLLIAGTLLVFVGCSSQQPRNNVDTFLCWLRPSCVPNQSTSTPHTSPDPPNRPQASPPRQPVATPQPVVTRQPPSPPPCITTVKAIVTKHQPSITISYVEPNTRIDGSPLRTLAKTTIYHNLGNGFKKTKDVPATNPKGGGTITETLAIDVGPRKQVETTICVTATNQSGQER